MANLLLPLTFFLLTLGRLIDITSYKMELQNVYLSIFSETDFVETSVNALNSTYYVLPDEKIPFSALRMPIDLVLRLKSKEAGYYKQVIDSSDIMLSRNFDSAAILFVTEYITSYQSIKPNATLLPNFQKNDYYLSRNTHYVDKVHHGIRCISLVTMKSNVSRDVQILRKKVRDIMGLSGRIGTNTVDLWRKVMKTIKESEDIRGDIRVTQKTISPQMDLPPDLNYNIESLLIYLGDFSNYVNPSDAQVKVSPLYVTLKPLHDFDKQYEPVQINKLSEEIITTVNDMENDLEYTKNALSLSSRIIDEDDRKKFDSFTSNVSHILRDVKELVKVDYSLYKDNTYIFRYPSVRDAIRNYQEGLTSSSRTYFEYYKMLNETIGVRCENKFFKPTGGSLIVEKDEVIKKDETGLKECQSMCLEDEKCRAVGYVQSNKQCLIYYRSTTSARIIFPLFSQTEVTIYDRVCH